MSLANRGKDLEDLLTAQNATYRDRSIAVIHKVPTAWVPTWRDGAVRGAHVAEVAISDFIGCMGSRAVAIEAKSTRQPRLPYKAIQPHQVAFLDDCATQGALCGLVVLWGLCGELWAIPWEDVRRSMDRGERKSMPWVECSPFKVVGLDYLARLVELEREKAGGMAG